MADKKSKANKAAKAAKSKNAAKTTAPAAKTSTNATTDTAAPVTTATSGGLNIQWLAEPEEHDYPAAQDYLSLIYPVEQAQKYVAALKAAEVSHNKAKDILRSSRLKTLGPDNYHVMKDVKKINKGTQLSPILLVRDTHNGKVVIADGYHRTCAVYSFNEDAVIPNKIVDA